MNWDRGASRTDSEVGEIEDFLGAPVRIAASISPDGTRIAYLAPWRGRLNVWVESVDSDEEARCVTADDNRSVHVYDWTYDPRWLLYQQDGDGDELWHIYRVDLENQDAEAVDLTPFPGAAVAGFEAMVSRPGRAFLHLNARNRAEFDLYEVDLYEVDIATGELTMPAENPQLTGTPVADERRRPRGNDSGARIQVQCSAGQPSKASSTSRRR